MVHFEVSRNNEFQLRNYFREQADHLDPIEGIWHLSGRYAVAGGQSGSWDARLAIVRDTTQPGRDFIEVVLDKDSPYPLYAVTAHFTRTSTPQVYISKQFGTNGSFDYVTLRLDDNGQLVGSQDYERGGRTVRSEWRYLRLEPWSAASRGRPEREDGRTGTGFLVKESGLVVTNYHVVDSSSSVTVVFAGAPSTYRARVVTHDRQNDLVVLQIEDFRYSDHFAVPIPFRLGRSQDVVLGQDVFTLGFPLGDIMGLQPRLSVGVINSLFGIDEDPRLFQISNPIQPGNSGGPLFTRDLQVVGVVVSTLNASYFFERARILPQNVNFAVKVAYLQPLLSDASSGERTRMQPASSLEQAVKVVMPYVVQVRTSR